HPRGARADDQHRTVRQLIGIAVGGGMYLQDTRVLRNDRRDDRGLEGAGCDDDAVGIKPAVRRVERQGTASFPPLHFFQLHATAYHDRIYLFNCHGPASSYCARCGSWFLLWPLFPACIPAATGRHAPAGILLASEAA